MSNHDLPKTNNPKIQARLDRMVHRDHWFEHLFRRVLHLFERVIAIATTIVLLCAFAVEIYEIITIDGYLTDISTYLHNILTIVIGVEFVRMLIDTTPANVLEVLTLAITRHVILSHDDPWSNLVSIVCIGALFATRRFLVRRHELKEEMVEME